MLLRTTATVSGVCGRAVAAARRCTNSLVPAATVAATLGGRASQRATMASTAAAAAAAAPAAAASSAAAAGRRAAALEALRRADVVAFDVDSTVITVEAIDEFAGYMGKRAEVAAQTAAAMGGTVPFDVALEARLSLLRPTTAHLAGFLASHPFAFTPHVRELVAALRGRGATVYLVSGGFTQMIYPVADALAIPRDRVYANTILFDAEGKYAGFDKAAPTSRDGGKAEVMRRLKAGGAGTVVMVGDGATDMQARPPADAFIGFGGIARRAAVEAGADWYTLSFEEVLRELA